MMNGPEKSDPGIVAMKPANKTEQSVAEPVERRAGTKGNADQQSTCRTQSRISVSQALERIRKGTLCRHTPEVGAVCGKAARTVLCGGRSAMSVPTASRPMSPNGPGRPSLPSAAEFALMQNAAVNDVIGCSPR